MRHVIVHYHIFKNAGSTMAAALARNFQDEFAIFDNPDYNKRIQPAEFIQFLHSNPRVIAISSHHLRPPAPRLEGVQFHEILILRDPLDRLRSMYDFYRRASLSQDPLTREAKRLDVQQFFYYLQERHPNLVSSPQLNLVVNGGARIPDRDDIHRGIAMLKDFQVLGTVEDFDECALFGERYFRPIFPGIDFSYVPENVTAGRANIFQARLERFAEEVGESLYERLRDLNQLESQFVGAAAQEAERRAKAAGIGKVQKREFRARLLQKRVRHEITRTRGRLQRLWGRMANVWFPSGRQN